MLDVTQKERHQTDLARYRYGLWRVPRLRHLFLELTLRCNENCLHCGSRCGELRSEELTAAQYRRFLDEIKADLGTQDKMLCITGGEPLLRQDFAEIMGYAHELGFHWGMTSNATLIDDACAQMLKRCGMNPSPSVSTDCRRIMTPSAARPAGGSVRCGASRRCCAWASMPCRSRPS